MIAITQEKHLNQTVYYKCILDDKGLEISRRLIHVPLFQVRNNNDYFFVLYDDSMILNSAVFKYLNFSLMGSPLTTRTKSAYAIRLLFCFLEISNIRVNSMSEFDINNLTLFLRGVGYLNSKYNFLTNRSPSTINGYFAIYRDFFLKSGIECEALFRKNVYKSRYSEDGLEGNMRQRENFANNLKKGSKSNRVSKYISVDEFKKIYKYVYSINDKQAMIILHFMFGYGLRIGEVLGLTAEDICELKVNEKLMPIIFLRNRLSDNKFQYAKGLPHVQRKSHYFSKEYKQSAAQITISYDFYEELEKYVNLTDMNATKKYPDNNSLRLADITSNESINERNSYVFLNRYGKPLSAQTWNKRLKSYFDVLGIEYDVGVKDIGLNHRFRHGFAMFHARFSGKHIDNMQLQKMMRHRSIMSTLVYYNPTIEDEYETKKQFLDELYTSIPELKMRMKYD